MKIGSWCLTAVGTMHLVFAELNPKVHARANENKLEKDNPTFSSCFLPKKYCKSSDTYTCTTSRAPQACERSPITK